MMMVMIDGDDEEMIDESNKKTPKKPRRLVKPQ